jgi:cytochrome P450
MLENEPPTHTRLRRLVAGAFGRGHVERLRRTVDGSPTGWSPTSRRGSPTPDGAADLLAAVAEPLPVEVIAELIGVPPADRHLLRPWSNAIVKMYEYGLPRTAGAGRERRRRVRRVPARASSPTAGARRGRRPGHRPGRGAAAASGSSEDEVVGTCVLLLMAGHEATVERRRQRRRGAAAAPGRVAPRRRPTRRWCRRGRGDDPVRRAAAAVRADGDPGRRRGRARVRRGEKVAALLGAANRDPAVFATRTASTPAASATRTSASAPGIHFCLGAPLARIEVQSVLGRSPPAAGPGAAAEPVRRPEFVIRGLRALSVAVIGPRGSCA